MSELSRPDLAQLRISDADRHQVADLLRDAAADGRIDMDELDERLEAAYAARTYADLVPITVDLPVRQSGAPTRVDTRTPSAREVLPLPVDAVALTSSNAVLGTCTRRGAWLVPHTHTAFALMGEIEIDLRQATLQDNDVTINANAIMGEVRILVDAWTQVVVDGTPIMGEFSVARDKVEPLLDQGGPLVQVRGMALMGSVKVMRLPAPGTPKKYFGTY